jgi:hypothetical protein
MTREALHNVSQEERRLRECISVAKAALDVANREAAEAKGAWWQPEWRLSVSWIPFPLRFVQSAS